MQAVASPTPQSLLEVLSKPRLVAVGREAGVAVPAAATKEAQVAALVASPLGLTDLLRSLGRDELRAACRAHGLDDSGRSRPALMERLLAASDAGFDGDAGAALPVSPFAVPPLRRSLPEAGDVVRVRHRVYLVEEVVAPGRLRTNTWEKDGVSRTTVEVVAQSVEFLRLKDRAEG
jgi:hypothetical protein